MSRLAAAAAAEKESRVASFLLFELELTGTPHLKYKSDRKCLTIFIIAPLEPVQVSQK